MTGESNEMVQYIDLCDNQVYVHNTSIVWNHVPIRIASVFVDPACFVCPTRQLFRPFSYNTRTLFDKDGSTSS